jgi:tRNA threonylcarbamoyladenosine biosynthesis protein TsaE
VASAVALIMTNVDRLVVTAATAARTRALGRRLARLLRAGDVVMLQGTLGAGKTTLAQGIGAGLHVEGLVRSPTFVLMTRHVPAQDAAPPLPLYHADLYRLDDALQVEDLALEDQARDGVLLIEWPERGIEALPTSHLLIVLEPAPGEPTARRITLVAVGDRYRAILVGLQAAGIGSAA